MLTVKTLHYFSSAERRLQLTIYSSACQSYGGEPILLGWVDLGLYKNQPPFTVTLSGVWLEGIIQRRQPCSSFADGLRRFVAVERLIVRHGLSRASELLKACQVLENPS